MSIASTGRGIQQAAVGLAILAGLYAVWRVYSAASGAVEAVGEGASEVGKFVGLGPKADGYRLEVLKAERKRLADRIPYEGGTSRTELQNRVNELDAEIKSLGG